MAEAKAAATVIYNSTPPRRKRCPIHDRRPIHPSSLFKVVSARTEWNRRHAWHYLHEAGCPLCRAGAPRNPESTGPTAPA